MKTQNDILNEERARAQVQVISMDKQTEMGEIEAQVSADQDNRARAYVLANFTTSLWSDRTHIYNLLDVVHGIKTLHQTEVSTILTTLEVIFDSGISNYAKACVAYKAADWAMCRSRQKMCKILAE